MFAEHGVDKKVPNIFAFCRVSSIILGSMTERKVETMVMISALFGLIGTIPSALADQNPYSFTVHVPKHGFGANAVTIFVKTANGYTDQQDASTRQSDVSWTFNIPANQGDTIQACVHTAGILNIINQNCRYWTVNHESGSYTVSMDSP
ncbi:MAG: hypothetical protein DLM72_17105 [Candidatus Nitrosopolaris wilkensis]|nr:MAG: hypothetical protein DLM72_17105 [Candidatus Nitrosopolaris wilkensis]